MLTGVGECRAGGKTGLTGAVVVSSVRSTYSTTVGIHDGETTTDHITRGSLIDEAKAWPDVFVPGIHGCAAVAGTVAVAHVEDSSRGVGSGVDECRAEARPTVLRFLVGCIHIPAETEVEGQV